MAGRVPRSTTGINGGRNWLRTLTSWVGFYVALGVLASAALILFLIVGYGMFRGTSVSIERSGPASEWAGALFTALSILVLAYQLRMIGLAAERREAKNLDLVQPVGRLTAWSRHASEPGWLLTVAVRNESEGHLVDPVIGLSWHGRPLDPGWLIGAPDEKQDIRNRTNKDTELSIQVSSAKISTVDLPMLLIHVPLSACAEMDDVGVGLEVSLEWGPAKSRSRRDDVPVVSARQGLRSAA